MEHQILISSEVEEDTRAVEAMLQRVIPAALEAEGVKTPCEVDVLLTNDEGIHQINLQMREVDRPTDVLSFPMFDYVPGEPPVSADEADPETGLTPLGDMVLSLIIIICILYSIGQEMSNFSPRSSPCILCIFPHFPLVWHVPKSNGKSLHFSLVRIIFQWYF